MVVLEYILKIMLVSPIIYGLINYKKVIKSIVEFWNSLD